MAQGYIQISKSFNLLDQKKMIGFAQIFLVVSTFLLQACAGTQIQGEEVVIDGLTIGGGQQSVNTQTAPAISSLLDQSQEEVNAGNLDEGARVLERALRIEPSNPEIWHRMAQIKFTQTDYAQAVVTASRSNTFVNNNSQLRALNLSIMLESYKAQGDSVQVGRVRAQIDNIQQP